MIRARTPTQGDMKLSSFAGSDARREFIEKQTGTHLGTVGASLRDEVRDVHCENLIGAVTIPLGIAGPVLITGQDGSQRKTYIPLATTEGALVASVSRGAKAVTESGGVCVSIDKVGASRGPVFRTNSIHEGLKLKAFVEKNIKVLSAAAESTSQHLKLIDTDIKLLPNLAFIRFSYDTQDAMGMNMATIATQKIVEVIKEKTGIECIAVAGNYDLDKKPAWLNVIKGRGMSVNAEVTIPQSVVASVLKTTPKAVFEVWLAKNVMGSAVSGSLGFNAHFANIVAAFFAATGQDLAHVVDGSLGVTTIRETENGDLYVGIHMPAVMVGTVGGGTKLRTQVEARAVTGARTSSELAEVLVAAVLAGEVSLLASLAQGTLASAHQSLGR